VRSGELRAFIALEIPPKIRECLSSLAQETLRDLREFKVVHTNNLHITLQFLGNCQWSSVPTIVESLNSAVEVFPKFTLSIGEPGFFPSKGQPRILHVGVDKGQSEIMLLASKIRKAMSVHGYREFKPFSPHITLARHRKSYQKRQLIGSGAYWKSAMGLALQQYKLSSQLHWEVNSVVLMESQLRPDGSVYIVNAKADLVP
jgi:2'-5' RNA ligase